MILLLNNLYIVYAILVSNLVLAYIDYIKSQIITSLSPIILFIFTSIRLDVRGGVGKAGSYRVSFLTKKIQSRYSTLGSLYRNLGTNKLIKIFPFFPSVCYLKHAAWQFSVRKKQITSYCSILNVRSGIALVSQSLPDGSQCWIGIYLALGRDQREAWLLAKGDSETEEGGGCFPSHQIFKTVILSLRHLGSSSQFLQKQRASLVWKW